MNPFRSSLFLQRIPYTTIPYFQTEQYNQTLRYSGQTENYYEVYIDGDVSKWDFIAYYAKANGEVTYEY